MAIRYWEYEDAPFKEKLKEPSVKEVAKVYFDNETKAYRFSKALCEVKKKTSLRLKDCGDELPLATWKRYLDFGVMVGMLKHEDGAYQFTDRYSKPLKNVSLYIKAWMDTAKEEDLAVLFANAKTEKQKKRGGRTTEAEVGPVEQGAGQGQEQKA
ncbi:MAG: hypothetical protein M1569_04165 [Candidatus Marsarchaeota archaeon]|nr:hypothetical protein [Candidatus Marsarchaeota archaeon]MCL5413567.1 hypothetical protein [Candidatus Marsarchaeota archaeon]